ncbi:MAG: hypothetical protein M0Z58_02470 [Nitrospiraceae bacterium]|nr:hypothetical protein [Nitrospiraceae bacterium]
MTSTVAKQAGNYREKRAGKWAWHLLALLFIAWVFSITTNFSLNDPDLWWHLKTGQVTLETHSLPSRDVFSYTTPHLTTAQKQGLRAHWLGQVIFYLAYRVGGYEGVGVFRGLLIVLPMLAIYIWLVKRGAMPWMAIGTISFGALMLALELFYSFERPQGISFLLSLLAIMLLEEMRRGKKKKLMAALLVLLMVFWANAHAGFIVGAVIIILYILGEAATLGWNRLKGARVRPDYLFFGGALLALIATGLNPDGYTLSSGYLYGLASGFVRDIHHMVGSRTGTGWVARVVLEYRPLTYFYSQLFYRWLMFYWVFTGALIVLLLTKYWIRKKIDLTEFFTVCFISFFANYYARGLMFSIIIMTFYYGKSILELGIFEGVRPVPRNTGAKGGARGGQREGPGGPRLAPSFFAVIVIVLAIWFGLYASQSYAWALKPGMTKQWVSPWYPIRADKFLKQNDIKPPMYNFYTWGGFLIWDLYPKYKVFVDGRALSNSVDRTADAILKSYPGWQQELDAYDINFILVPVVFRESGYIIPISVSLINDPQWKLVFIGDNSAIFVRNRAENADIIKKYSLDKKNVLREIVNVENILIYGDPSDPIYNINKADAMSALGYGEQARLIYRMYPDWVRKRFSTLFGYYSLKVATRPGA